MKRPSFKKGDTNLDGSVNYADHQAIADHIMGRNPNGFIEGIADLNEDGAVDAADLVLMTNLINP